MLILFVTLLFANFAEAIAEARGKAQADSLRKTREETPAKLYVNGNIKTVSSSLLKKGDEFVWDAGDVFPPADKRFPSEDVLINVKLSKNLRRVGIFNDYVYDYYFYENSLSVGGAFFTLALWSDFFDEVRQMQLCEPHRNPNSRFFFKNSSPLTTPVKWCGSIVRLSPTTRI